MEIISYVLTGALEHRDNLGNGTVIQPGEVQRMTAGTGITHSEFNPSPMESVHFLQIWILPEARGLPPGYEQKTIASAEKQGVLRLVASRDGRQGSVTLHQNADLYVARLSAGDTVAHALRPGRSGWLQLASGAVTLNGQHLLAGDGAAIDQVPKIEIGADTGAEVLLFDLA
jgi:hypothetical protein